MAAFVSACGGGGSSVGGGGSSGGGGSNPVTTPTPGGFSPTNAPISGGGGATATPGISTNTAAFACPSSDSASSATRGGGSAHGDAVRRAAAASRRNAAPVPGRLAVTYSLPTLRASRSTLAARETSLGASLVRETDFARLGIATRIVAVSPQRAASVEASLRMQPGVRSVAVAGYRRYKQTVTTPYFTNDPYFTGFSTTLAPTASSTAPPATFEIAPYEESANVPGMWNMHAIGLEHAFGYSQSGNGSGVTNASALGSSAVKIAIIDTGEDTTHPELQSKIAYQKCFITDPATTVQSTSNYTTDEDGHGTDTSGIAAAAGNNGLGFVGAGDNSSLYAYRVEATPDDSCVGSDPDDQCSIDTNDIASAIEDAIAEHVNVISLSLGGGGCTNGVDQDTTEGDAIADALAANIIVVASSGNDAVDGTESPVGVEAPACDTGVIAAGASALEDGQPNGDGNSGGSSTSPSEYVASYSDYGSPGAAVRSSSAWGIVAPGGDPSSDTDADDLHWIEDVWTSTPFDSNFAGSCTVDYPGNGSTTKDCRTLIAGTSMSSPTVAGAAALILAVSGSTYQSPSAMKSLLCSTADDIGSATEGCGRLNVYRAMAKAVGDPTPP